MIVNAADLKLFGINNQIRKVPSLFSTALPINIQETVNPSYTIQSSTNVPRFTLENDFIIVDNGVENMNSYFRENTAITLKNGNRMEMYTTSYSWNPNLVYYLCKMYDSTNNIIGECETYINTTQIGTGASQISEAAFIALYDSSNDRYLMGFYKGYYDSNRVYIEFYFANSAAHSLNSTTVFIEGGLVPQNPYITDPISEPGGGYGDFDYSGDPVLPPDLPTVSVADSGFVTLYAPTETELRDLAAYMWSGLFDVSNWRKLFADPMDCIISLNIVPVTIPQGTAQNLKVGNISTGISVTQLSAQFIKIKYKTLNIGVRTNSFMDYSPYVKCQIFLPFIGAKSINIDDIAGANINLEYHIDLFSGACTAYIVCSKLNSDGSALQATMYQFTGNICANVPFTSTSYNGFLGSLLQTAGAAATAIVTHGASAAAGAVSSGINTVANIKPDIDRSGNVSSTAGFLGVQVPYLILTYPHVCNPEDRDKTVGTPSFIGLSNDKKLNAFHGLTQLRKINVKGIPCTETERQMIESQLLGEGVILI